MRKSLLKTVLILWGSMTAVYAANGTLLIGYGAKSRAMGGIGIATFTGTDAVLKNPAMVGLNEGDQFDVSSTSLYQSATVEATGIHEDFGTATPLIPSIGYITNVSKNVAWGFHAAVIGGGGIAYDDYAAADFLQLKAKQAFIDTAAAIAIHKDGFSISAAFVISSATLEQSISGITNKFSMSSEPGFEFGWAYKQSENLTYGMTFKTERKIENSTEGFILPDYYNELPAEYGVGINYRMDKLSIALDMKRIMWGESGTVTGYGTPEEGYATAGFVNQNVYVLGLSYEPSSSWTWMGGLNLSKSPVSQQGTDMGTLLKVPAFVETHITGGFSWNITPKVAFDMALKYAFEKSQSSSVMYTPSGTTISNATVSTEQAAATVGLAIKF